MTTSGTASFTLTAAQIITYALKKIGIVRAGGAVPGDAAEDARLELEMMLKEWALTGPCLFTRREGSVELIADTQSYSLCSETPLRILHARFRDRTGRDVPMEPLTRHEYFNLPFKNSRGTPSGYYFDPQGAAPVLHVWPMLAAVNGEAIQYTYQRRIEDIGMITNAIDIPQEWLSTAGYSLAARLLDDYGIADAIGGRIRERAQSLRQLAMDYEREDTFSFCPDSRW
jgi:hypothetical protein